MHVTLKEIREQDEAIVSILREIREKQDRVVDVLSESSSVLLTGCGTSYYLGLTAAALLNEKSWKANATPGSEVFISPEEASEKNPDIILPISRSGETTETVKATEFLKENNPDSEVVGITCNQDSSIYELSDVPILSPKGDEESVVMTKSFSSMLGGIEYLSLLASGDESPAKYFRGISDEVSEIMEDSEEVGREIGSIDEIEKYVFLGTGEYYGLASEAMLKVEEMTLSWSKVYHPLEFRHGPRSIVEDDTLVTVFWPQRAREKHRNLLEEIRDLSAKTLAVGPKSELEEVESDYKLKLPSREEGPILPLYMPIVQLLGYYRAVDLGLNPDEPQNLSQVVKI